MTTAIRTIALILLTLMVVALVMVIVTDFTRMGKCHDLGGIYHRGTCLDPSSLVKV